MADAVDLVEKIKASPKKESALFDFVYQKFDESLGNEKSHTFYGICLDKIEYMLFHQISKWINSGKIEDNCFIKLNEENKFEVRSRIELEWRDVSKFNFQINVNTLPLKIDLTTANKILFIGDWVQLLRIKKLDREGQEQLTQLFRDINHELHAIISKKYVIW